MLNALNLSGGELAEAVAGALDTMAFICPEPAPAAPPAAPPGAWRVWIEFAGADGGGGRAGERGVLELVAGAAFGALLASNLLGPDLAGAAAAGAGLDALKELTNVACGAVLSLRPPDGGAGMGLPQAAEFDPARWADFIAAPAGAALALLDAEGHSLAVRLRRAA